VSPEELVALIEDEKFVMEKQTHAGHMPMVAILHTV
jgi:hypothetical protein